MFADIPRGKHQPSVRCLLLICRAGHVRAERMVHRADWFTLSEANCMACFWPWEMHFIAQGHLNIVHHQRNCTPQERLNPSLKSGNMNSAPAVLCSPLMNQTQAVHPSYYVYLCVCSLALLFVLMSSGRCCLRLSKERERERERARSFIHPPTVHPLPPGFRCFQHGSQHRVSLHMAL